MIKRIIEAFTKETLDDYYENNANKPEFLLNKYILLSNVTREVVYEFYAEYMTKLLEEDIRFLMEKEEFFSDWSIINNNVDMVTIFNKKYIQFIINNGYMKVITQIDDINTDEYLKFFAPIIMDWNS